MKNRADSRRPSIRIVNLEEGKPTVPAALTQLASELTMAFRAGCPIVKLIHGYGSSGTGGDIRLAVQRKLVEMREDKKIRDCIFGEAWAKSDEHTWKLLQAQPELKNDSDLGRKNFGITIVAL